MRTGHLVGWVGAVAALACAPARVDEAAPEEQIAEECDGTWQVQITNMLSAERVRAFYFSRDQEWTWLGTVYASETRTFSLEHSWTMAMGRLPDLNIASESGDEIWVDPRYGSARRSSPDIQVVVRCNPETN